MAAKVFVAVVKAEAKAMVSVEEVKAIAIAVVYVIAEEVAVLVEAVV